MLSPAAARLFKSRLFTLDRAVYVAYEGKRRPETDGPQHEEEAIAHARHVPKEERRLHEPAHVGPRVVVVEAIPEDEQASRTSAEDAPARAGTRPYCDKRLNN